MSKAVARIDKEIDSIVYESPEDEGAAEWEAHLRAVREELQNGMMTIADAEDSLGLKLI